MKKIVFSISLILVVLGIIFGMKVLISKKGKNIVSSASRTQSLSVEQKEEIKQQVAEKKQEELIETVQQEQTKEQEKIKADIVMGNDFFVTQINEFYANFEDYEGKTVEIEGFKLMSGDYTFIGRYGPGCCVNDEFACLEYSYNGDLDIDIEKDWVKMIGKLTLGNDNGVEYIYLDVLSAEILQERGIDTVYN